MGIIQDKTALWLLYELVGAYKSPNWLKKNYRNKECIDSTSSGWAIFQIDFKKLSGCLI